jgi:hypothetical protein
VDEKAQKRNLAWLIAIYLLDAFNLSMNPIDLMKTLFTLILLTVSLISFSPFHAQAQQDFRSVAWGMNLSSVKGAEPCQLLHEETQKLVFACSLADINGKLYYMFTGSDRLLRSKYLLTPAYLNMNFFIRDYKMFQDVLTQKYGAPSATHVVTVNKAVITEVEWAANLLSGNARMETRWEIDNTIIVLTLSKMGDAPAIQIDYISKEFAAIDLTEKKAKIIKDI